MSGSSARLGGTQARWLSFWVFLTLSTASLEGYLEHANANLNKVAPALLFLAWIVHLLRHQRLPKMHAISWLAVTLLVLVMCSSAMNVINPLVAVYDFRWAPFLILVVVLIDCLSTVVPVRVAFSATVVGAVISGSGALYSFLVLHDARATGPLSDPNDLAYVLVTAIPFLLFWPNKLLNRRYRFAQWLGAFILVAGATATLSRGAATAVACFVIWAVARRLVSMRVVVSTIVVVAIAAAVGWVLASSRLETALAQKQFVAEGNISVRELRWEAAARILAGHPFLGVGPGGFKVDYVAASNNAELAQQQTPVAHDMYLEVGAELGVLGLGMFVAIIAAALASSEALLRTRPDRSALAVQGSLLLVTVASVFLSEEYYMPLWSAIAMAGALHLRSKEGERTET